MVLPWRWGALGAVILLALGFWAGARWNRAPAAVYEAPAVAVRQADSSLVLARRPDTVVVFRQALPPGAVAERRVSVVVQGDSAIAFVPRETLRPIAPAADTARARSSMATGTDTGFVRVAIACPPDTVDLSLVRLPDRTHRVIASARGSGRILSGIDVPLDSAPGLPRVRPWAVGVAYDANQQRYGAALSRDLGPLRLGATAIPNAAGVSVGLSIGVRF